jgi:hypothetical protein
VAVRLLEARPNSDVAFRAELIHTDEFLRH